MRKYKIYLAGPEVFRPDAVEFGEFLKRKLEEHGFEGLYPFDNKVSENSQDPSLEIYQADVKMMDDCDAVLANIEPFRGPSVDPGTAFEIGYVKALGKPVIGYNASAQPYNSRVVADEKYPKIEDFGLTDNLMIARGCDTVIDGSIDEALKVLKTLLKKRETEGYALLPEELVAQAKAKQGW